MLEFGQVLYLTLPDHQSGPAGSCKPGYVSGISSNVFVEFLLPEFGIRRRTLCPWTPHVSMPKTAMNKDDFLVFRQNDVGISGEVRSVDSKAMAHAVK